MVALTALGITIHQMDELARLFNWTQTRAYMHTIHIVQSCLRGWMRIWIQYFVIWLWFLTVSIHTIKCLRSNKHQIDTLKSRDNRIAPNKLLFRQYYLAHPNHYPWRGIHLVNRSLALAFALRHSTIFYFCFFASFFLVQFNPIQSNHSHLNIWAFSLSPIYRDYKL